MVGKIITCKNATLFENMLTRGKEYKVLDIDYVKKCVKLKCDNGRTRLFSCNFFDLEGKPIPILVSWKFDDSINDIQRDDFLTWVEVTLYFSDGTERWCKLFSPDLLSRILNLPNSIPGIFVPKIILVKSFDFYDIDRVLRYLDENDELIEASRLIHSTTTDFEDS